MISLLLYTASEHLIVFSCLNKMALKKKKKTVKTDKGGHYVMIKDQSKKLTIINIYAPNIGASKYVS